jgi:hypothetical protein
MLDVVRDFSRLDELVARLLAWQAEATGRDTRATSHGTVGGVAALAPAAGRRRA